MLGIEASRDLEEESFQGVSVSDGPETRLPMRPLN